MQNKPKTGCGCGGSAGGCGGGCGGGGGCKPARLPEAASAICSPCATAAFVRPRFFAGQLLTEDDLGALIDYVVSKHRFHNARLFGAGVVCGLEVECGPCESSQIVVQPGYALDCCGNDLVLTCKQTLDIAPMIRELAAKRDGGCTDPCPPPRSPDTTKDQQDVPAKNVRYCLYARYAERPDQPVAAYPVGDDCDAAVCEPTRVVEGIVFELRCPPPVSCGDTVNDGFLDCAKWLDKDAELTSRAVRYTRIGAILARAGLERKAFEPEDVEILQAFVKQPIDNVEGAARVQAINYALAEALPLVLQHQVLKVPYPKGESDKLQTVAKKYVDTLRSIGDDVVLQPLEARMSRALVEYFDAAHEREGDVRARVLAGPFASREMLAELQVDLEAAAKKLQEAGCTKTAIHTDCTLRGVIDAMWPALNRSKLDTREVQKFGVQLGSAGRAIWQFFMDCWCAAINPPCPPCDDPGVLLACFEVDRCNVVTICNTVRCYVLAPSTLRYWNAIQPPQWIERCCTPLRLPPTDDVVGTRPEVATANVLRMEAMARPAAALHDRVRAYVTPHAVGDELAELRRTVDELTLKVKRLEKEMS